MKKGVYFSVRSSAKARAIAVLLSVGVSAGIAFWSIRATRTESLSPADLRWKNAASMHAPRPISTAFSQLRRTHIKSARPFLICQPPMGPSVLSVIATPREYLHFEQDPIVSFVVNEDGGVQAVKIERTSSSPEVDAKAISVVQQTKYQQSVECVARWSVRATVFVDF